MRLDLFVKLKYQSNAKILSVGITYSVRDLLFDVKNYSWTRTGCVGPWRFELCREIGPSRASMFVYLYASFFST